MAKYVLQHGSISNGKDPAIKPSADPAKPTVLELEEAEAAKLNGRHNEQLLPGVVDVGPILVSLSDWQAARAGEAAKAKAIAEVKAKSEEKPKGGGK